MSVRAKADRHGDTRERQAEQRPPPVARPADRDQAQEQLQRPDEIRAMSLVGHVNAGERNELRPGDADVALSIGRELFHLGVWARQRVYPPRGDLTRGYRGDENRERQPSRGEACRRPPGPHLAIAQRPSGEKQHDGHQQAVLAAQQVGHAERDAEPEAALQPALAPKALDRRQRREHAGKRRQRQHVEVCVHRRQHHQHGATRQRDCPRPP